jgi:hypothetical protein
MSNSVTNQMYEALGRATWAVRKRRMKQRARHMASARHVAIGALVLGVIGIGAIAARAGSNT